MLGVLVALTLLTAAVSVYGAIPRWSVAVPILLIVVFLVVARRQVRRANETYWRQAADARTRSAAPTVVSRPGAARVDASHGVARKQSTDDATTSGGEAGTAGEPAGADHDDEEPTVTLTAEQVAAAAGLSEERVVAVALHTADGTSLWDPLPITLPTYVEKPVAKRSVRKITIGESGTWSAGHSAAASSVAAGSTAANATRQAVMRDQESADGDETDEEVESAEADERPAGRQRLSVSVASIRDARVSLRLTPLACRGRRSGAVAQLVARLVRIEKARGSNPLSSTTRNHR